MNSSINPILQRRSKLVALQFHPNCKTLSMVARLISSEITAMAWASKLRCTGPDASGNALSSPDRPPRYLPMAADLQPVPS